MILIDRYYINKEKINYFYTYTQCNLCSREYIIKINFDKDNFITCSFFKQEELENAIKLLKDELNDKEKVISNLK